MQRFLLTISLFVLYIPAIAQQRTTNPEKIKRDIANGNPSPEAMLIYGDYCNYGQYGVKYNPDEAVKWYTRAANHRKRPQLLAMQHLAEMYNKNIWSTHKNNDSVVHYLRMAAQYGEPGDRSKLGILYEEGEYLPLDFDSAIHYFRIACRGGDITGYIHLGFLFEKGYGLPQNFDSAFYYYQHASNLDSRNGDADYFLSRLYRTGNGVQKDESKALNLINSAARKGSLWGSFGLGEMYLNGYFGADIDLNTAEQWLRSAVDRGNREALFAMGELCMMTSETWKHSVNDALSFYEKAAKRGHVDAALSAGLLGKVEYYLPIVKTNDPRVWYFLGAQYDRGSYNDYHYEGSNLPQNYDSALHYYHLAANAGNVAAINRLGLMYLNGVGVPTDTLQSLRWYHKASLSSWIHQSVLSKWKGSATNSTFFNQLLYRANSTGDAAAQDSVGTCYLIGDGTTRSYSKAVTYYRLSANQGYAPAMCHLADLLKTDYLHKEDSTQPSNNVAKANEWYDKAANLGYNRGYFARALPIYDNPDESKVKLTRIAAELGDADAQSSYGYYFHKTGNKPDPAEFYRWTMRAARQGNTGAAYTMAIQMMRPGLWYYAKSLFKHAGITDPTANFYVGEIERYMPEHDMQYAEKWYRHAIDDDKKFRLAAGYAAARLSQFYLTGQTGIYSPEKARQTLQHVVSKYSVTEESFISDDALFALGNIYENGLGGDVMIDSACECYARMTLCGAMSRMKYSAMARLCCPQLKKQKGYCGSASIIDSCADSTRHNGKKTKYTKTAWKGDLAHIRIDDTAVVYKNTIELKMSVSADTTITNHTVLVDGKSIITRTKGMRAVQKNKPIDDKNYNISETIILNPHSNNTIEVTLQRADGDTVQKKCIAVVREKRVALVIGNRSYPGKDSLTTTVVEAREIAKLLGSTTYGYRVILCTDVDYTALRDSLEILSKEIVDSKLALVYYTGHAQCKSVEGNTQYCLRGIDNKDFEMSYIIKMMESSQCDKVVIVDACRSFCDIKYLQSLDDNVYYINAVRPGEEASDGERIRGKSLFALAFIETLHKYLSSDRHLTISTLYETIYGKLNTASFTPPRNVNGITYIK